MNKNFANYATSTAFRIELTKAQISALNSLVVSTNSTAQLEFHLGLRSWEALLRRGLVEQKVDGRLKITRAGELTVMLLDEAGLISKSKKQIVTPSFAKAIHESLKESA